MYEDKTYEALLAEGKAVISDDIQKGEGSLVHNAVSVLAFELERLYIEADYMLAQLDPETADYENLVKLCARQGVYPSDATYVEAKLVGDAIIPVGARFNLSAYNYVVTEVINADAYEYRVQCETAGSAPNGLLGATTPITYVDGLTSAVITEIMVEGANATTKEELLAAYKNSFDSSSFGGNVASYKQKVNSYDGIGGCKVQPVPNGGGTAKVVVISSGYGQVSSDLVNEIAEDLCPTPKKGYGIAAIGHDVSVASVSAITVNIKATITFMTGYSWATCQAAIKEAIGSYLLAQRTAWANGDDTTYITVYISRIESAILSVNGVLDVADTKINGSMSNLILSWDAIPVLGTVQN